MDYWQLLRGHMPERFDHEVGRFAGLQAPAGGQWENTLFSHFVEAMEYTAVQRGCERWDPK